MSVIEIIQAEQVGKQHSLADMHKVRKCIFKDRMGWDVDITQDGLEIDNYDVAPTVYILVRDDRQRIVGVWRLTPTTGPSMIREIWPQFLKHFPVPASDDIWELSRFGVHSYDNHRQDHIHHVNVVTAQLILTLIQTCILVDIPYVYTMYHKAVGRSIQRVGFIPDAVSQEELVDGKPGVVVRFPMNSTTLERVQHRTGLSSMVKEQDLPPILRQRISGIVNPHKTVAAYA